LLQGEGKKKECEGKKHARRGSAAYCESKEMRGQSKADGKLRQEASELRANISKERARVRRGNKRIRRASKQAKQAGSASRLRREATGQASRASKGK
jgi:uncharacterized protein YlxW (UPF0749 family)